MNNESGLRPLGRAVLVRPYQPEIKKSVIELPKSVGDRQVMIDQRAVVIEVGPACWPDEPPRAAPGDKVLISKMAGFFANTDLTRDGGQYLVVNDKDIFCALQAEDDHE